MLKKSLVIAALCGFSTTAVADIPPAPGSEKASRLINFAQVNESTLQDGQTLVLSVKVQKDCNSVTLMGGWDIDHETKTISFAGNIVTTLKFCGPNFPTTTVFLESETDEIFLPEDGTWRVVVPEQFADDTFRRGWINHSFFGWTPSNSIFQILFPEA